MTQNINPKTTTQPIFSEQRILDKYGWKLPANYDYNDEFAWAVFLAQLDYGIENKIVTNEGLQRYWKEFLPLNSDQKLDYAYKLESALIRAKKIADDIFNQLEAIYVGELIEDSLKGYPREYQILAQYMFYSLATGEPVEPEVEALFEDPKKFEQALNDFREVELQEKIIEMGQRKYNRAFTKDEIKEILNSIDDQRKAESGQNQRQTDLRPISPVETQSNFSTQNSANSLPRQNIPQPEKVVNTPTNSPTAKSQFPQQTPIDPQRFTAPVRKTMPLPVNRGYQRPVNQPNLPINRPQTANYSSQQNLGQAPIPQPNTNFTQPPRTPQQNPGKPANPYFSRQTPPQFTNVQPPAQPQKPSLKPAEPQSNPFSRVQKGLDSLLK